MHIFIIIFYNIIMWRHIFNEKKIFHIHINIFHSNPNKKEKMWGPKILYISIAVGKAITFNNNDKHHINTLFVSILCVINRNFASSGDRETEILRRR